MVFTTRIFIFTRLDNKLQSKYSEQNGSNDSLIDSLSSRVKIKFHLQWIFPGNANLTCFSAFHKINFNTPCTNFVLKSGNLNLLEPSGSVQACNGIALPFKGATRWRSWLRHCATRRKVAGSIPDGVNVIFHWYNPSERTMALGSTQPLTEINTRNISWV